MRPQHVLHFIQFLLPAIAFCVSEELVALITHGPLSAFNRKRLRVFQMSVLEMKNEGVDKSLTRIEPAYGLFIL